MARNTTAEQQQPPNIWTQMSYVPPRGPCFQKSSFLTSCPCFRFMIHPLKAATSFECDGCGHHASFHKMDNRQDEEYERQWKSQQQTLDTDQASQQTVRPSAATRVGSQGPERNGVKGFEIIEKMLRLNDDESAAGRASKKRRITAR